MKQKKAWTAKVGSVGMMMVLSAMFTSTSWAAALQLPGVDTPEFVSISAVWSMDAVVPGEQAVLAVVIQVAPEYHIGNAAALIPEADRAATFPTEVKLSASADAPEGLAIGGPDFPGKPAVSLDGRHVVYVPVDVPVETSAGQLKLELSVTYQACNDTACFPPETIKQKLDLIVVDKDATREGCPDPKLFARWSDRRAAKPASKSEGFDYKSKEPPIGPPWVRNLETAQAMALRSGKPIFLYSTKTFCPHCVIVESEMLSSPKLKPYYDQAVWLYVYRDFQGGEEDRRAQRIGDRYSLSSWPQLWLVDPQNLETLGETGRTVSSFAKAVSKVQIAASDDLAPVESLRASERRVIQFEENPNVPAARQLLQSDDVVAQISAARYLAEQGELGELASQGATLLAVPNDALRYETLKAIAATKTSEFNEQVADLVARPEPSRNFNVLRSHAIRALTEVGEPSSLPIIAPHAQGTARNSTTRAAIEAMVRIADRHPDSKPKVIDYLAASFPPIEAGMERLVTSQAKLIHGHLQKLSGQQRPFPADYTEATRQTLSQGWAPEGK